MLRQENEVFKASLENIYLVSKHSNNNNEKEKHISILSCFIKDEFPLRDAESREIVFPQGRAQQLVPNTKWSALKTCIQ